MLFFPTILKLYLIKQHGFLIIYNIINVFSVYFPVTEKVNDSKWIRIPFPSQVVPNTLFLIKLKVILMINQCEFWEITQKAFKVLSNSDITKFYFCVIFYMKFSQCFHLLKKKEQKQNRCLTPFHCLQKSHSHRDIRNNWENLILLINKYISNKNCLYLIIISKQIKVHQQMPGARGNGDREGRWGGTEFQLRKEKHSGNGCW